MFLKEHSVSAQKLYFLEKKEYNSIGRKLPSKRLFVLVYLNQ